MSSRDITFAIDNPDGNIFRIKKHGDLELSRGSGGIPHCEVYQCANGAFLRSVLRSKTVAMRS